MDISHVLIERSLADSIHHVASTFSPWEVTALLVGKKSGGEATFGGVLWLKNYARSPSTFLVKENDIAVNKARYPSAVFAFFHSHIQTTSLSQEDEKAMLLQPGLWIVGQAANDQPAMSAYLAQLSSSLTISHLPLRYV